MLALFAHHANAYFALEIMGREFPDGMTEHILLAGVSLAALLLMLYGAYAATRDLLAWRRQRTAARTGQS